MATMLDKLFEYHQLTHRLYQLNQQIESQRRRARAQEKKLGEHSRQVADLHEQLRRAQADAAQADLDLKTRDAQLDRLRTQLNVTKTNKEYSTLLREINTFKVDSNRLEEDALQKLARVDALRARTAEVQELAAQEQRRLEDLQGQAQAREQELDVQVRQVAGLRDAAAAELPGDLVAQFNRLADAHEGEAMAPIVKAHPKRSEYICGGCNMSVTLEQVNTLQSRGEIQTCYCCGRLLYLDISAQPSRS